MCCSWDVHPSGYNVVSLKLPNPKSDILRLNNDGTPNISLLQGNTRKHRWGTPQHLWIIFRGNRGFSTSFCIPRLSTHHSFCFFWQKTIAEVSIGCAMGAVWKIAEVFADPRAAALCVGGRFVGETECHGGLQGSDLFEPVGSWLVSPSNGIYDIIYIYIHDYTHTYIYICIRICICICIWYDNICIYVNRQSMYSNICNRCMKKYEQMDNDGHKKNDRTNNH